MHFAQFLRDYSVEVGSDEISNALIILLVSHGGLMAYITFSAWPSGEWAGEA